MSFETWLAFLVAAVLIGVLPGAVAVACMATGMRHGYQPGICSGWSRKE
jgi:threonine/homoserine/homoserine lactone efflux protein